MPEKHNCTLLNREVDDSDCYDIQMMNAKAIKKDRLKNFMPPVDENIITEQNWKKHCENCTFNQLI